MEKFFFERLLPIWRKWYGGLIAALSAAVFVLYSITDGLHEIEVLDWIVGSVVLFAFLGLWLITNPAKRNPRGQIGVCIAIRAESDTEHSKVQYKLIDDLKRRLRHSIEGSHINLVCLPNHECEELDSVQAAMTKLSGTRSHLILYGRAVTGNVSGKPVTSIGLEAVVIHSDTEKSNRDLLSQEMRIGIPKDTIIEIQDDLRGYEMLSTQLDQVAKYVIAIAAFLSRDFHLASKLLHSLEVTLNSMPEKNASLSYIAEVVPKRIRMVKTAQLNVAYAVYVKFRATDNEALTRLAQHEPLADELLAHDPNDYRALLYKSIVAFAHRRDLSEAENLLRRCGKFRDATWMYNFAFLLTYKGDLWEAHDMYKRAFASTTHLSSVPVESEEFIHLVMTKEPDREHLVFAVGLINYNAKKDFELAAEAFEKFVTIAGAESAWPEAFELSSYLLKRCRSRI
jgi:tetratricopeptide (TPR) repeat protein